jgi:hypothetical protein
MRIRRFSIKLQSKKLFEERYFDGCTKIYRPAFEIYQKAGTGLQDKQGLQDATDPDNHVIPVVLSN